MKCDFSSFILFWFFFVFPIHSITVQTSHSSTFDLFTQYVYQPFAVASMHGRGSFRGGAHALRDLVFPEFRKISKKSEKKIDSKEGGEGEKGIGLLDRGFDGETIEERALRDQYRVVFLEWADKHDVGSLFLRYPGMMHSLLAIILGVFMLAVLGVAILLGGLFARSIMGLLWLLTGSDEFIDGAGLNSADGQEPEKNPFGRMFDGTPIEYDWDPRLSPEERRAFIEKKKEVKKE